MVSFFLKKNFYDGCDNLLWIVCFNVIAIAVAAAAYFSTVGIFSLTMLPEALPYVLSFVLAGAALFFVVSLLLSVSDTASQVAAFKAPVYKDVFANLKNCFKDAALLSLVLIALVVLVAVGIPFYLKMQNIAGLLLASVLFWAALMVLFSLQWFMPLRSQLKGDFSKTLRKCFIVFFDNAGFSIFLFIYNLFLAALSCLLVLIMPGITGIILAQNNALRLRLYKYDWLEEHPDLSRKEAKQQLPWQELIAEDKETLGPRNLKSLIFPWKY